jgi:hypothetical protein
MTTSTRYAGSPSLRINDEDLSSSPDPLALSVNDENSFPVSFPIKGASLSPKKNRRTKVLEDITLSSPQRGRRRSMQASNSAGPYQSEQLLSPWKIRVTIEAEPEEPGFARMKTSSKTTTVPPHDPSSPTRAPRFRGRSNSTSRQSGGAIRAPGSPARRGRKSTGPELSRLTDMNTSFLDHPEKARSKPKRKQGTRKPRKASGTDGTLRAQNPVSHAAEAEGDTGLLPPVSDDDGDIGLEQDASLGIFIDDAIESPELRELDFNRISVRSRGRPAKAASVKMVVVDTVDNEPHSNSGANVSTAKEEGRRVSGASAIIYPTPDASVQDDMEVHGPPGDPTEDNAGFDTIIESEGFSMIDLESLPSARYLATSPDNPDPRHTEPSTREDSADDLEQARSVSYPVLAPISPIKSSPSPTKVSQAKSPRPTPIPSYLALPEEGESDLSSTVPSSPPVSPVQHPTLRRSNLAARSPLRQAHTPQASATLSPTLPSPPNQAPKAKQLVLDERAKSTPPRLGRVVRAGIALQGLLSPKVRAPSLQPSPIPKEMDLGKRSASTPQDRLDNLFVGFDSGARRELRAGLRFGEELAKRQRLESPESASSAQHIAPEANQQTRQEFDTAWAGETLVKPTPARDNDLSAIKVTSCKNNGVLTPQNISRAQLSATPFDGNKSCGSIFFLDAEARERRWQTEREAVSRQIENANTSQVIVIESDDEDEKYTPDGVVKAKDPSPTKSVISEGEEDIWLAEAESAQNSSRHSAEDLFPPTEQIRQRERAREVISKPRRTLIPSPWKRGAELDTTFMTNDDASGIFWKQNRSREVTSSSRGLSTDSQAQQSPQRNFDIKRMIGDSSAQRQQIPAIEKKSWDILEDTPKQEPKPQSIRQNKAEFWVQESNLVGEDGVDTRTCQHETGLVEEEDSEAEIDSEVPFANGEETYEESSITPGPTMVPVNFNDTTELSVQSRDHVQSDAQLESPQPSPPRSVTPRSALKGSRASLNFIDESESPAPRRVMFSRHSLCLDDSGLETSMQVRGDSLSPAFSIPSDATSRSEVQQCIPETQQTPTPRERENGLEITGTRAVAPRPTEATSWLGKLTGWGSKAALAPCPAPAPIEAPQQQRQLSAKAGQLGSDIRWEPTRTALTSSNVVVSHTSSAASAETPSYVSDPRYPPPPETLPVSGYFSDNHYKHLHILYLKSLKATFTRPGSIRPALKKCIGQKFYSGDGEFAWEVTKQDAEAVERWMRSFEGREAKEVVSDWTGGDGKYRVIGWDEEDLCKRLFSIVAGQEVRREKRERRESGRR